MARARFVMRISSLSNFLLTWVDTLNRILRWHKMRLMGAKLVPVIIPVLG
jgi:hypothetical protein